MAGGNPAEGRQQNDHYPTPMECTFGLMDEEMGFMKAHNLPLWEPACGDGAISKLFRGMLDVISTDLFDYGYGISGVDFLASEKSQRSICVTNPPFKLAEAFIRKALEFHEMPYVAMLLKSTYFHAKSRIKLFNEHRPAVVYALTWRPDFMKRGAPTMDVIWAVWDKNRTGTEYKLMERSQPSATTCDG